jgi:hypothetical protein
VAENIKNTNSLKTGWHLGLAIVTGLALVGIIIWRALYIYLNQFPGDYGDQAAFGAFGDYVGGLLNPVLSFFAVGLLIYSVIIQRKELALTRMELARTTIELSKSNETHMENLNTQKQVFYTQCIVDELAIIDSSIEDIGREAIDLDKDGVKISYRNALRTDVYLENLTLNKADNKSFVKQQEKMFFQIRFLADVLKTINKYSVDVGLISGRLIILRDWFELCELNESEYRHKYISRHDPDNLKGTMNEVGEGPHERLSKERLNAFIEIKEKVDVVCNKS